MKALLALGLMALFAQDLPGAKPVSKPEWMKRHDGFKAEAAKGECDRSTVVAAAIRATAANVEIISRVIRILRFGGPKATLNSNLTIADQAAINVGFDFRR